MKHHVTTKRHFAIFKAECERLAKLWELNDWEYRIFHGESDSLAECDPRPIDRIMVLRLGIDWGPRDVPTDARVLFCARHEMSHAITGELLFMAQSRHVTKDEIVAAAEITARRLERLLP